MEFPKPLQDRKGDYKVYLHSKPKVGDIFWSLTGQGRKKTVQHFKVIEIEHYKSRLRGEMATLITWQDQNGNLAWSGMRSKSMSRNRRPEPNAGGKPAGTKKLTVGQFARMNVKSPNRDSQVVIQQNVAMTVSEIREKSKIVYWDGSDGGEYWSNKGENFVRPFPEKRKTTNCSDNQNA